jgi:hypothetical protein
MHPKKNGAKSLPLQKGLAGGGLFSYNRFMANQSPFTLAACSHYVFTAFPYENLGERGFHLDQRLDREEPGLTIQTLMMNSPRGGSVALEFLEIMDEEDFKKNRRLDSSWRGREVLRPQLRLVGETDVRKVIGGIPVEVVSRGSAPPASSPHPNSVHEISGLYLGLTESGRRDWAEFLGLLESKSPWSLADDTQIFVGEPGDGLYEFMDMRKDFPLWAVILKCQSLSSFIEKAQPEKSILWRGRSAALIKEHLTDWDILIVE